MQDFKLLFGFLRNRKSLLPKVQKVCCVGEEGVGCFDTICSTSVQHGGSVALYLAQLSCHSAVLETVLRILKQPCGSTCTVYYTGLLKRAPDCNV